MQIAKQYNGSMLFGLQGGVLMGPSGLGMFKSFSLSLFPYKGIMVLETMANLGLVYYMFLVGLEMDLRTLTRTGRKAVSIAVAGFTVPFTMGTALFYVLQKHETPRESRFGFMCWGTALGFTAFPVLIRILAELKLIHTELGRTAMASAIITELISWVFLALTIALSSSISTILWAGLSTVAFVLVSIFVIRPVIAWIVGRAPEKDNFSEFYVCLILTGVTICGFITDACGVDAIVGAFVFGLIIPNGVLRGVLVEKLEEFVTGLLLPLYFTVTGLRTNVVSTWGKVSFIWFMGVVVFACIAKAVGVLLVSFFYQLPVREGAALGMLLNTKGLLAIVVLNVGRDKLILNDTTYTIMVLVLLSTTIIIIPIINAIYKPVRRFMPYKRRTIQRSKPNAELRMLACIHATRNIPSIINLLEASNGNPRSPICIFVLHLVELTGRASAMLIVHSTNKAGATPSSLGSTASANHPNQSHSDQIVSSFEKYEQESNGTVSVQPLTASSPYATMHEDICSLAEDKRVAIVILPFHKHQTIDGNMEDSNAAFRGVNQNVLVNAPCSVGILVDRGLGGVSSDNFICRIAMLYIGGPDDREALYYAWRMSGRPGIQLTVVRFVPGQNVVEVEPVDVPNESQGGILTLITDYETEKNLDEEFINDFRLKTVSDEQVVYVEKVVNNGEETVTAIRSMEHNYELYLVGRGQGMVSPLTTGLSEWSDCPELGAIGDILVSSDFASKVSVLVVQQYAGIGPDRDSAMSTPDGSGHRLGGVMHKRMGRDGSDGFEPFVNHGAVDSSSNWKV